MAEELHYTSLPQGLDPGSQGFSVVGITPGMPPLLRNRLEAMSGYRELYPPGHPDAIANPINWSHTRVTCGGRTFTVLSRVAFAGVDYSGRTNKYAHHVVLALDERSRGGPAWLLMRPGVMAEHWSSPARILPARVVPQGDVLPEPCREWHRQTGDAGWGGVLARHWSENPGRPCRLVWRIDQAKVGLRLLVESLALLPPEKRWEVTFATYAGEMPRDIQCSTRCFLAEQSPPAATREELVIDLSRPLPAAPHNEWTRAAREGAALTGASVARSTTSSASTLVINLSPTPAPAPPVAHISPPTPLAASAGPMIMPALWKTALLPWILALAGLLVAMVCGYGWWNEYAKRIASEKRDVSASGAKTGSRGFTGPIIPMAPVRPGNDPIHPPKR